MSIYQGFPFPDQVHAAVASELNRVRFPSGGYDLRNEKYDKKSGPLGLLCWITAGDWISVQVWARGDLGRSQKKEVENIVADLCRNQGIPAAASWVQQAWSSSNREIPRIELLVHLLNQVYDERLGTITNGMVSDSINKWKR
jgi:hypothetical protein